MSGPRVSIVTVVRNDREGFRKTLASVVMQEFKNIEYIVVDGASTDGTAELVRAESSRIAHWVSEPDRGVYDAMNKGWRLATGEWVVFLNAGDWFLDSGVVASAMEAAGPDVDAVYGDAFHVLEDGKRHFMPASSPENVPEGPFCCHQSLYMRRSLIAQLGGFRLEEWPASDYGLIARAFAAGCRWRQVSRPFVEYAMGGISDLNARQAHQSAWNISRTLFGNSLKRDSRWAYWIFRDVVRDLLRFFGLNWCVIQYRKFKAWQRGFRGQTF